MKIVIDIPEDRYETLKMLSETPTFYLDFYQRLIVNGTPLPEGAEILTAEAYSDLCLRASRIPCYLGSPCEYQNEDIKIPHEERKTGRWKAKDFHTCYCPNCNFTFDIMNCDFMDKMRFCPNCGAKMEGAEE